MNEYIYKSFAEKFESQKLRHDLLSDIRYPNNINFAIRDPTNVGGEDVTSATNTSIYGTDNTIHTPLIIAVYSAHLDIMANRQIITRA